MQTTTTPTDERPLGQLVSELTKETSELARQEVALAKAEMKTKAKEVARDGAMAGVGAVLVLLGVLGLFAALILGLSTAMEPWAAALLVGVLFVALGGVIAYAGAQKLSKVDPKPRETVRTMQDNKAWLKEQMSQ